MRPSLAEVARRYARTLPVRALVAVLFLGFHLVMLSALGKERFGLRFNASPTTPPAFVNPAVDDYAQHWDRLVVSRWDSQHYITFTLRGYQYCASRAELGPGQYPDSARVCQVMFYPGYPLAGRAVMAVTHMPVDYALFAVSLISSFIFMLLFTSDAITDSLGVGGAYLSLLLMNAFTTGYVFVSIYTEPLALCLTLGSYVLFRRNWLVAGALLAGAVGVIRPTGIVTEAAYGVAILATIAVERPRTKPEWIRRLGAAGLAGWGTPALMAYWGFRFGDPLLYAHAVARHYAFTANVWAAFWPKYEWFSQSIWAAPNDGVWIAATLLWFALGHRAALGRFPPTSRAYFYALFLLTVVITMVGRVEYSYVGSGRYVLLAIPLFFAMAVTTRRNPALLAIWMALSIGHYWCVNACYYVGRGQPGFAEICHFYPG